MLYFREVNCKLGDRVVNLNSQKHFYVPFGAEGTVTAYAHNMVEVLWDEDVLNGKSTEMERQDLLNLSVRVERASLRRSSALDRRPDFNSKYTHNHEVSFVPEIKEVRPIAPEQLFLSAATAQEETKASHAPHS
jgi:hypothetical protein